MACRAPARVVHDQLIRLARSGCELSPILVGTTAWYDWLNAPETRSFSYETSKGRWTVRRELRQSRWYWYAYQTRQGKLCKLYLGKAEELSQHHLAQALDQDNGPPAQHARTLTTCVPARSQPVALKTNLILPSLPEFLVSRPRLLQLLQRGAARPLTFVCAPAGFGKTALVREWIAQSERPYAWISLDCKERDPWRFLTHLVGALQHIQPGFGSDLLIHDCSRSPSRLTKLLARLLNELTTLPENMTIIFDNYHLVANQRVHDALAFLLERLPPHVHVLIASRSTPGFPLARLRVSEKLIELHADDLRFTSTEIEQLLITNMHLALEPTELAQLEMRTEGWIAGLYLAWLTFQGKRASIQDVATLTGSNRFLLDYLREEVLAPQSEQVQAFLLATSLPAYFNVALCNAMTGQTSAEYLLERMESTGVLLIPHMERAGWYRYPRLWAEALRHHLHCTQPELAGALHRRASQWFEEQGMNDKAIEHALAVHDEARAATLIESAAPIWLEEGEIATLQQWLDALPDVIVRASPRLCICKVWLTFITSQASLFLSWIKAAEQALLACQEKLCPLLVCELRAEIAGLRAFYLFSFNDFANAITVCNQMLLQLPEENLYPRSLLLLVLGFASTCGISASAGSEPLFLAHCAIQAKGHALLLPFLLVGQAEIALARGSPTQAVQFFRQILALAAEQNMLAIYLAGLAHVGLGRVFWEWNNLEMARLHLLQAWDLGRQTQTVNTLFMASILLIQVAQAQRNAQEEDFWLQQMEELSLSQEQTVIPEFVAAMRVRRLLSDGEVETALFWMRDHHPILDKPDRRYNELRRFTQVRVLLAAARAYADESYVLQALKVLDRLHTRAEESGNIRVLLESLILHALAFHLAGRQTDALATLKQAVSLAEPGRYIRLFMDEGNLLTRLLRQLLEHQQTQKETDQTVNLTYLSKLLKALATPAVSSLPISSRSGEPILDPLSWREHEVLCLLADGRKNREIADELVVVTGTVKAHINAIYQKLGVNNRIQAVERARTLGLL